MNKNEVLKELGKLRDYKNYSQNNGINVGYREGILDAIDLVESLTLKELEKDFYCRRRECKFHNGNSKNNNVYCQVKIPKINRNNNGINCESYEK